MTLCLYRDIMRMCSNEIWDIKPAVTAVVGILKQQVASDPIIPSRHRKALHISRQPSNSAEEA